MARDYINTLPDELLHIMFGLAFHARALASVCSRWRRVYKNSVQRPNEKILRQLHNGYILKEIPFISCAVYRDLCDNVFCFGRNSVCVDFKTGARITFHISDEYWCRMVRPSFDGNTFYSVYNTNRIMRSDTTSLMMFPVVYAEMVSEIKCTQHHLYILDAMDYITRRDPDTGVPDDAWGELVLPQDCVHGLEIIGDRMYVVHDFFDIDVWDLSTKQIVTSMSFPPQVESVPRKVVGIRVINATTVCIVHDQVIDIRDVSNLDATKWKMKWPYEDTFPTTMRMDQHENMYIIDSKKNTHVWSPRGRELLCTIENHRLVMSAASIISGKCVSMYSVDFQSTKIRDIGI